ncbi:MAG: glycoside hydrolase [Candidatus Neomarinimicrobiota bacterium]|nr:MAG: glycoside hydrolase [Candidatus Neomarinimicrobiota bacterium]
MKRNYSVLILLFTLGLILTCTHCRRGDEDLQALVEDIGHRFAPDSRVAIWSVKIERRHGTPTLTGETTVPQAVEALRDSLEARGQSVQWDVRVLPVPAYRSTPFGVVTISVTNLRGIPDRGGELVTQAILGTPVRRYKRNDYWDLIQTPDGYLGWVDRGTITWMDSTEFTRWRQSLRCLVTVPYALVLADSGDTAETVSDAVAGSLLEYSTVRDGYWWVRFPDGRTGKLRQSDAVDFRSWLRSSRPMPDQLLLTAKRFRGFPYLWGGTSTKGFDCSGFTKTVYFLQGWLLPRDASQQVTVGQLVTRSVDFELLQPGDLLFFGRKATADEPEHATHVGLYLGNTEFIHSSGRVKINSLDSTRANFNQYRYDHFLQARRILSDSTVPVLKRQEWYVQTTEVDRHE